MSLNWKNSLRTIKLRPPEEKKSANSLENDFSNIPIYTQILNYEQSLKKLIVNDGVFSESVWNLSLKLAKISNQYALTLIKSGKYELAETTLLKNKQIIEPLADKSSWENKLDWQIMRITIISNLLIIFQKLQKPLKLYQILKNFFPNLRLDILFNYPQCFERDIDPIFISMTLCCFNFKRYEEAEMYANDGIKLIRKILRNDFLLFSIQAHFQKNKLNWDNFLNKKNYSLGKLLNILGKISEKLQKKDEAINHYSQAYNLMKMFFGEDSKLTLSFKQDLSRLRELSPLLIKLKSEYNLNNNCDMSLNDQKDNTQTEVFTKKNNSNKSIFSPKYNITNNNDENIISIKKNISFARLANNEMTNSRKRKCFTIHETCKNIVSEHTKLVIKNKKSRPFSANTKLKSKEFLSDYLLTRKESMGKFPDIFKIKIFYPDNASKKIGKRDRIVNESVTADFQSTKLINSIQFDKSSLKSVLNAHRKNQKSNNETTTQFVLDLNDSQTNQTSKYSLILAKRPTSSSRFPKGITRQTSTIEKRLSNHFSLKNSGKSEEESNITNSKFEHKIEGSENQSMSQIKMFDIPNFETEIKNTSPFNSPKMKIPKRISETVNSSSSKIKMNSKRFSNIIGDESQNYNLRGNFIKTDFKLAPEENTPKSSFFDKNIFSNKRTHIDVGQFTKQKIEFLRPSTPQQNKNMFSLKSEKKILSQTQLFSYMQHQEKIIVIQRFLKLCLKKLKKIIPLSSIEKPKEKESSITLSRNLNNFIKSKQSINEIVLSKTSHSHTVSSQSDLSLSEKSSVAMENFGNDELKTLKCVNFRLLTNLNSGFFEWVLDSFYFEQHAVGSKEMSSTIRFLIKNNSKSSFFFFFCIKDSFSLGKLNINYQWIVYDFFLSKWLQKFDNSHQFPHFQFESSIEKKHYVILQKKCQFDMTVSDLDCLENFVEKLCYIINLFYSLMRRTTGYSWVLIEKLDNYSPKNIILVKSLKQHLNDKSNFRKEIAIFASNPIINKPKLNKISHQRQRQGSLNSIFTSQENSDREHITQNELLLLAPSTLISKLTTKNEIFMNNEKEGSTHLNDSQNLNNGIIEQKKIEEAILKKPPLQKIYTEDQNLEKIKKKKIFSTTSNKLDYESSKLSLSQINKKENFESNRLNRAITSNAISTNGLFRKINSELKKKSLNSLNKSNLELSKLEIENYDVRKILRWEDLHLKGLKECSIFPNEKPKIQHFPDVYFYMFSNNDLLLQLLTKYERIFFLVEVNILTSYLPNTLLKKYEDLIRILRKTKFKVSISQQNASNSCWKDQLIMNFFDFLSAFLFSTKQAKDVSFKQEFVSDFFNKQKFKKADQIKIISSLLKKIKFENLKISITDHEKELLKPIESIKKLNRITVYEIDQLKINLSPQITSDILIYNNDIKKLEYYNTIQFLCKPKYYLNFHEKHNYSYLRFEFKQDNTGIITQYYPFEKKIEYCRITSPREIEKIINILQLESKTLLQKVFNSTFSKRNYLNGNKKSLSDAWNYNYPKNFKKSPSSSEFFFLLLNENNTTTIFKSFVLFENYKIINIGSSYIKVTGFFKQKNSVDIMKLEIRPTNTKTRIYKFMISSQEIRNYINSNFSFDKSKNFLSKINTDILKNITLTQDKIYRKLIIPFKKISQSSGHRFEDLKMLSPDSNLRPINEINFISPYFNAYRVIFKKVKKIGNFFAILSVKKHNVFDFWIIKVHVPRTSRDYSCRLFKSDLIGLSQNFFDETYPIQMIELKKIFEENYEVGYHEFSNKYELLLKMRKIISIVKSNFLDDPGILEEEKSNKFSKFSSKRFIEFVEYKFWEILLIYVDFQFEKKKIYLLIDNYKGTLQECLFDEVINIDPYKNELVSLEILLENNRKFIPMSQNIPFISYKNSSEFDLNINMKSLIKSTSSNEKISLKDIILTYNEKDKEGSKTEKFHKKQYNQVFLKELSLFIKKKIQNDKSEKNHIQRNSLEIASNMITFNALKQKIKLNQKIKFQALHTSRDTIFLLIYQTVFTIKPKQIISILFCKQKSYFLIFIYDNKECTYFKQKLRRKKIIYYIPNLEEMIKLQLLNEIGERIFKVFKNSLLASSYYKSNLIM